jgi:hypothetical protein
MSYNSRGILFDGPVDQFEAKFGRIKQCRTISTALQRQISTSPQCLGHLFGGVFALNLYRRRAQNSMELVAVTLVQLH